MVKAVQEVQPEELSARVDSRDLEEAQRKLVQVGVNLGKLRLLLSTDPTLLEEVTSDLYSNLIDEGKVMSAAEFLTNVGEEVERVCALY